MEQQTDLLKCLIPSVQIYEPSKVVYDALFMNPAYYLLNEASHEYEAKTDKMRRLYAKALLYLHTLPFQYSKLLNQDIQSFFNRKTEKETETEHGGLEVVPNGFVLFLGGLIWRKKWYEKYAMDPFMLGTVSLPEYKATQSGYDPLLVTSGNSTRFCLIPRLSAQTAEYVQYKDIVNEDMDIYTENLLLQHFIRFADTVYIHKMAPLLELKCAVTEPVDDIATDDSQDPDDSAEPTYPTLQQNYITVDKWFTSTEIRTLRDALKNSSSDIGKMLEILNGSVFFNEDTNGMQWSVLNFTPLYSMGFFDSTDNSYKIYLSETNEVHRYFTELYNNKSIAIRTGYNSRASSANQGLLKSDVFKSYVNGLCNVLETNRRDDTAKNNLKARTNKTERLSDRDLKIAIYMELKNLWDRWLCGYYNQDRNYFDVKEKKDNNWQNTLFANFVFIDSFYNDISYMMRLNCDKLLVSIKNDVMYKSDGGTNRVSTHLGNVVSEHKCMMYNFPDYVGFDGNAEHAIEVMETLFKPLPVSKIEPPRLMNKFVVIYANFAQMLNSKDRNSFNNDSFNIYSYKDGTEVAPVAFSKKKEFADKGTGQMGYIVPSFCVEYSRQNNSYWTNIGINTSSHANTEVGAMAMANIAEKGNSSKRQICFYGQDVYPIYQAYSYMVTIEMLGNAQIQPLMYFQLLNIPMFTGAYMVINVEHNITPGMMKTTVTGMRMTKVQPPYTKAWFTMADEGQASIEPGSDFVGNGERIISNESTILDIADDNLSKAINDTLHDNTHINCDEFVREVYGYDRINVEIERNLKPDSNGIDMLKELMDKPDEWDVHEFKRTSKPSKQNNWEPLYSTTRPHPVCGDLLFGYHGSVLYSDNQPFHHVSIYLGLAAKDSSDVYVAEGISIGGTPIQEGKQGKIQICSIQDSRMGLATDVITHWAHCKKYLVGQNLEDTANGYAYEIVSSAALDNLADIVTTVGTGTTVQTRTDGNTTTQFSVQTTYTEPSPNPQENPQTEFTPTPADKKSYYTIQLLKYKGENQQIRANIQSLIDNVLDPVTRSCIKRYGPSDQIMADRPTITSGYRSPEANRRLKNASKSSQHLKGMAADLSYKYTRNGTDSRIRNLKFAREVVRGGVWDQLIIENPLRFDKNNPANCDIRCAWVHVSYNRTGNQRNQILFMSNSSQGSTTLKSMSPSKFSNGLQGLTEWFMQYYRVVVPNGD